MHTLSSEKNYLDKIVECLPKYHEMYVKYKNSFKLQYISLRNISRVTDFWTIAIVKLFVVLLHKGWLRKYDIVCPYYADEIDVKKFDGQQQLYIFPTEIDRLNRRIPKRE